MLSCLGKERLIGSIRRGLEGGTHRLDARESSERFTHEGVSTNGGGRTDGSGAVIVPVTRAEQRGPVYLITSNRTFAGVGQRVSWRLPAILAAGSSPNGRAFPRVDAVAVLERPFVVLFE